MYSETCDSHAVLMKSQADEESSLLRRLRRLNERFGEAYCFRLQVQANKHV